MDKFGFCNFEVDGDVCMGHAVLIDFRARLLRVPR
jgi:hypothetical protein